MEYHLIAITIAIFIDWIIGDPPTWPHPVKWIGSGISKLEKRLNQGTARKGKGAIMLIIILVIVFLFSLFLVWGSYQIHPYLGVLLESILIATTIAQKGLKDAAIEVYHPLKQDDLTEARKKLSYIVGRDTEKLDEAEIVRGTVETVAENTSDGITAPLFWAFIGGAPLALVYRAINTCDSMVGYKNERFADFGWASARLDDLVNWLPSRITGIIILMSHRSLHMKKSQAWKIFFRDAKKHPSPNGGWLEAAVAVLLGVQLGGVNYYQGIISNRAKVGEPIVSLNKEHIIQTNKIITRTIILFLLIMWGVAGLNRYLIPLW